MSAGDLRTELEVIRQGYLANRAGFQHGKCRFTYSIQSADTEADALAGKWNDRQPRISRTFTWYFTKDAFTIKTELDGEKIGQEIESGNGLITPITIAVKDGYTLITQVTERWSPPVRY